MAYEDELYEQEEREGQFAYAFTRGYYCLQQESHARAQFAEDFRLQTPKGQRIATYYGIHRVITHGLPAFGTSMGFITGLAGIITLDTEKLNAAGIAIGASIATGIAYHALDAALHTLFPPENT